MTNEQSLKAIENAVFSKSLIKPLYDSYCFSNIPQTIKNILLTENNDALPDSIFGNFPQTYDKVVLFLVDGFGWKFFQKYSQKYPFLKHFDDGVVSKLTAQFPSTTPAELTTIHTGLSVGEHGVYEWVYYEPEVDALISPLLYSFAGKRVRDTLIPTGVDPKKLFPTQTLYSELKQKNIASHVFLSSEYASSPYTSVVLQDAKITPYSTLEDGATRLKDMLLTDNGKAYYYFYFGGIDSIAHRYGTESEEFEREVKKFFETMEEFFFSKLHGLDNTVLLLTADHGHTSINPQTTIYINKQFPKVTEWVKTNRKGEPIVPAGACRDLFIHIKDEHLEEAYLYLQEALQGKAEVYKVDDLIGQNFFGSSRSQKFLDRVGNLVILGHKNESVWWYEEDKFEITYFSHHGGLTRDEMEILFACLPFRTNVES